MWIRLAFVFSIILPSLAAVEPPSTRNFNLWRSHYMLAMENPSSPKNCERWQSLASEKDFPLQRLAEVRFLENCSKKKLAWDSFLKTEKKWLHPLLIQLQYDHLIDQGEFLSAYRWYKKHPKVLELDKRNREELLQKSLKQKIGKKERRKMQKELEGLAPRFIKNPKKSEFLKVARDFRKARHFEKALSYYRRVINDKGFSLHQKWFGYQGARITYKLERWKRMKKYLSASEQWARFLNNKYKQSKELTRLHHNANIEFIRTLWTERGQKEAYPHLLKLEKQLKKRFSLQLVYWLKGRMAEEKRDYKMAVHWLDKASKERAITSEDEERVLWFLAWNQRRTGSYAESQKNLEKLKKHRDLTFFAKTKYLYWQAENLLSMGKKDDANGAFERLANLDAYGYYGPLAFRKLNKPFPALPDNAINETDALKLFSNQDDEVFRWLSEVGELDVAENFLFEKVSTKKSWGLSEWVSYLHLLQMAGAYKTSFYRYHSLSPKLQLQIAEEYPELLFPRPYRRIVTQAASESLVSTALIYSIMKQESGFDVKARSHADAFGLLQLIPQVAQRSAQRLGDVLYKKPEDLYTPKVNIPLGAETLRFYLSKFENQFVLAVASYNANEKAVRGWIDSRFHGDPVTFIEDIPYEETKGYVKLVMRNYIAYNRFETARGEKFQFPEVCLQGLQAFKN
ncbi:MAG: lytic transglycosylase domain-containing protein [Bdellovibrionales bacterium]|nr:lytic transglycosylase domain-containing protein [Bdellovibrionales bacterium]